MIVSPADSSVQPRAGARPNKLAAQEIDRLVNNYTDNLMRAAFSLGFNENEAEELVQDTFVALLDGADRFKGKSKLLTYLFGILYNKARETRRYRDRHDSMDASIDQTFDDHFTPWEGWQESWTPQDIAV